MFQWANSQTQLAASVLTNPLTKVQSWEDIITGSNNDFNAVSVHSPKISLADLPRLDIMPVHLMPLLCFRSCCCSASFLFLVANKASYHLPLVQQRSLTPCFPTVTEPKPCSSTLHLPNGIPMLSCALEYWTASREFHFFPLTIGAVSLTTGSLDWDKVISRLV